MNTKTKTNHGRKPYTMSRKAHAQRVAAAHSRPALTRDWTTVKIAAENAEFCKREFGTPNEAVNTLREMTGGEE